MRLPIATAEPAPGVLTFSTRARLLPLNVEPAAHYGQLVAIRHIDGDGICRARKRDIACQRDDVVLTIRIAIKHLSLEIRQLNSLPTVTRMSSYPCRLCASSTAGAFDLPVLQWC